MLGYAKLVQEVGTLFNTRASIVCYIFSEIVSKPLIPWSIYSMDLAISVNNIVMYYISWMKTFWYGPFWSASSFPLISSTEKIRDLILISSANLLTISCKISWVVLAPYPLTAPESFGAISSNVWNNVLHWVVLKPIYAFGWSP